MWMNLMYQTPAVPRGGIDLFDPGSGSQVHDFNGRIAPSGLFWSVWVPDHALTIGNGTARLSLPRVHIVDSRTFLGPVDFQGEVSIDLQWTASRLRPWSQGPSLLTRATRGAEFVQLTDSLGRGSLDAE
jgi:hypothetical protein